MSNCSAQPHLDAKSYNDAFAFRSGLWKLRKWLNEFETSKSGDADSSTTTKSDKSSGKLSSSKISHSQSQGNANFRSMMEELQTMLHSHHRKYHIRRVSQKPATFYTLLRELKTIGENIGLSFLEERSATQTVLTFGSHHGLSQFSIQIALHHESCDVIAEETSVDITLCLRDNERDEDYVDVAFDDADKGTMAADIQQCIDVGDFELLSHKFLLLRYFDDFLNFMPELLLRSLQSDGTGSVYVDIELCMKTLSNTHGYTRLLDGPCIAYARPLMDCILQRALGDSHSSRVWQMSFVGLYPSFCLMRDLQLQVDEKVLTCNFGFVPIVAAAHEEDDDEIADVEMKHSDSSGNNNNNNAGYGQQHLLYWFVLRPSVIVPLYIAQQILRDCIGTPSVLDINHRSKAELSSEHEMSDKRSRSSSWMQDIGETYSYHNMLIGGASSGASDSGNSAQSSKNIHVFEDDSVCFKTAEAGHQQTTYGVKLDHIFIRDLKYRGADKLEQSTLFGVVQRLKHWVALNQMYMQCFTRNRKKWKLKKDASKYQQRAVNKFEISIGRNCNQLQTVHISGKTEGKPKGNAMELDQSENDEHACTDEQYSKYQQEYKLPPKCDDWLAVFHIDDKQNVDVQVTYQKTVQLESTYAHKINTVFQKSNSVPITLCYICKLFDGRYLYEKLQQNDKLQTNNDDMNHMVDID